MYKEKLKQQLEEITAVAVAVDDETTERQGRILSKANCIVRSKGVRRSPVDESSRNIWIVSSFSQPGKWYKVEYDEEIGAFHCECKAFEYSKDNCCIHLISICLFEGGGSL